MAMEKVTYERSPFLSISIEKWKDDSMLKDNVSIEISSRYTCIRFYCIDSVWTCWEPYSNEYTLTYEFTDVISIFISTVDEKAEVVELPIWIINMLDAWTKEQEFTKLFKECLSNTSYIVASGNKTKNG